MWRRPGSARAGLEHTSSCFGSYPIHPITQSVQGGLPHRLRVVDERGFTLIELLVVILVIGILAAIALPAFLSQQNKAKHADAKSQARNLTEHVEMCFAETSDYTKCDSDSELGGTGLDWGSGPGQVSVQVNPYGIAGTA